MYDTLTVMLQFDVKNYIQLNAHSERMSNLSPYVSSGRLARAAFKLKPLKQTVIFILTNTLYTRMHHLKSERAESL